MALVWYRSITQIRFHEEALILILHLVPRRICSRALNGDPDAPVEYVMGLGPPTIRPDTSLNTVVKTLRISNVTNTLAADPEGRLIGSINL